MKRKRLLDSCKQLHPPRKLQRRAGLIHRRPEIEILENRLAPATSVSIADASVIEPSPHGTADMDFTVTRTGGDLSPPLMVDYTTLAGSAQPFTDFTPVTGTATFAAGSPTATIAVPVFGNGVYNNPNLTFTVQLTGIAGASPVSFANHVDISTGIASFGVVIADLNGDGKPDIIAYDSGTLLDDPTSGDISVLLNATPPGASTPSFSPPQIIPAGRGLASLAVADLNGDGKPDLIVTNQYSYNISVLLNTTPTGSARVSFAPPQNFNQGAQVLSLAVGDVNGDGKPDLAVVRSVFDVSVLLNTTPTEASAVSFTPQQSFAAVQRSPYAIVSSLALADINGDGKPDIITTNGRVNTVSVLLNTTPTGATVPSFAPPVQFNNNGDAASVAVGDFNGDGRPDLVVTSASGGYYGYSGSQTVLLNTTPPGAAVPSFAPPQTFSDTNDYLGVAVGDVTGDGKLDIVGADQTHDTVSVLLITTPPGAAVPDFTSSQPFNTLHGPLLVALADINGDGQPDVIVSSRYVNAVSVLLNTSPPAISRDTATGTIVESDPRNDVLVNGSTGDNTLTVSQTPGGGIGAITYVLNGGAPVSLSGVTAFGFDGQGGNDTMTVIMGSGGPLIAGPGPITFEGGDGTNTLTVDAPGQVTRAAPDTFTICGSQALNYSNVSTINIDNAAAIDTIAGPDTADRASAFAGLTANERFVQALYLDNLGRPGVKAELDEWVAMLDASAAAQSAVTSAIVDSPEARDRLVKSWYVSFLGRQATNAEELGWVNALLAGQSEETVLSGILASTEFYNRAQALSFTGSMDQRYIDALYILLLGRNPGDAETAGWVSVLPQLGGQGVALDFLDSTEFRTDAFEGYYEALLHRPADATGLNDWLASPLDLAAVRQEFESSPEFYQNG